VRFEFRPDSSRNHTRPKAGLQKISRLESNRRVSTPRFDSFANICQQAFRDREIVTFPHVCLKCLDLVLLFICRQLQHFNTRLWLDGWHQSHLRSRNGPTLHFIRRSASKRKAHCFSRASMTAPLPLHELLGIPDLRRMKLVVDNAKSPAHPVSFRKKPKVRSPPTFRRSLSHDSGSCRWSSSINVMVRQNSFPNDSILHSPLSSDRKLRPPTRTKSPNGAELSPLQEEQKPKENLHEMLDRLGLRKPQRKTSSKLSGRDNSLQGMVSMPRLSGLPKLPERSPSSISRRARLRETRSAKNFVTADLLLEASSIDTTQPHNYI